MSHDFSNLGLDSQLRANSSLPNRAKANKDSNLRSQKVDSELLSLTEKPARFHQARQTDKPSGLFAQEVVRPDTNKNNPIQSAINRVSQTGGGRVLITAGEYTISTPITLKENVSIEGIDTESCIFNFSGTANLVTESGAGNFEINNLTLTNSGNGSATIYLNGGTNIGLRNLGFGTSTSTDIFLDGNRTVYVENIRGTGGDRFMNGTACQLVYTNNCFGTGYNFGIEGTNVGFSLCSFQNVDLWVKTRSIDGDFDYNTFANCRFSLVESGDAVTNVNLDSQQFTGNNTFIGCFFGAGTTDSNVAIALTAQKANRFVGCTVGASLGSSIGVAINNSSSNANTFIGNHIQGYGTGKACVKVNAGSRANLVGNYLDNKGGAGTLTNSGTITTLAANTGN